MAKFTAKKVELTLELVNLDGEKRVFEPFNRVTGAFSEKILKEFEVYQEAQKALPASEQDKMLIYYLKFLSWVYKDLDTAWIKSSFTHNEIKEIFQWVNEGLLGAKKGEES